METSTIFDARHQWWEAQVNLQMSAGASEAQVPIQNYMYPLFFLSDQYNSFGIPQKYCF